MRGPPLSLSFPRERGRGPTSEAASRRSRTGWFLQTFSAIAAVSMTLVCGRLKRLYFISSDEELCRPHSLGRLRRLRTPERDHGVRTGQKWAFQTRAHSLSFFSFYFFKFIFWVFFPHYHLSPVPSPTSAPPPAIPALLSVYVNLLFSLWGVPSPPHPAPQRSAASPSRVCLPAAC